MGPKIYIEVILNPRQFIICVQVSVINLKLFVCTVLISQFPLWMIDHLNSLYQFAQFLTENIYGTLPVSYPNGR